jgi:hypothetical protein
MVPERHGRLASGARRIVGRAAALLTGLIALGCNMPEIGMIQVGKFPRPMIFTDTLQWTKEGSDHFNTVHDFHVARDSAYSGIGTLEGLYTLVPEDENALLMLTRGWTSVAFGFIDDEREAAMEGKDETLAEYHTQRGKAACNRARFFGERLIAKRADGFEKAQRNANTLDAWLAENFQDDDHAQELLWLGVSIVGQVNFDRDNPATVANLWMGVQILKHVIKLDENVENALAHSALGSYHSRTAMAELADSKAHFERAIQLQKGKLLLTKVSMAQTYYCMKGDKKAYTKLLEEVLSSGDPSPEQRISNAVAKRKARRYLANDLWQEECAFNI